MLKVNYLDQPKPIPVMFPGNKPILLIHKTREETTYLCFLSQVEPGLVSLLTVDIVKSAKYKYALNRMGDKKIPSIPEYTKEDILSLTEFPEDYDVVPCDVEINVTPTKF